MKILINCLILILFVSICKGQSTTNKDSSRYIIFLHNKFLELEGLEGSHPEYGKVEFTKILETFRSNGFKVISEIRPKNANARVYARKASLQIDSLVDLGVNPEHITVIGTSKGGYIAMITSAILKNKKVNFVFIGCCSEEDVLDNSYLNFCGHILSIYEKSDNTITCSKLMKLSTNKISSFSEIELNTGLKHGYLYKAMNEWLEPSMAFAKSTTKQKQKNKK